MDERTSRAKKLADRLIEEFYGGTAEKDWPMWATDAVTAMERYAAALSQPAAQGDSSHSAGGECGGVQVPSVTVIGLDAIYAAEIARVSNVAYDSQAICRWFYKNLRDAICAKAAP